ncbi:MAG: RelA/SpoT domain-containing protein [Roseburia sp.]
MFKTNDEQKTFLRQFNISEEKFRASLLTWDELELIAEDYMKKEDEHTATVKSYFEKIQQCAYVHSLGYRVKEVTHLLEKVIRKNPKYLKQGKAISHSNYTSYINDLMGIRILLLFKEDWLGVHEFLMKEYGNDLAEEPFAYIRKGDNRELYAGKVKIIDEKPYRSVHYLIRDKASGLCIEVQVRTLFEEAWSEIDHKLRYPYNLSNEMIGSYLEIMNRVAGMADEMGTFLHAYLNDFESAMEDGIVDENEVYGYILEQMNNFEDCDTKENIVRKIKAAQKYKELTSAQDIFKNLLKNL